MNEGMKTVKNEKEGMNEKEWMKTKKERRKDWQKGKGKYGSVEKGILDIFIWLGFRKWVEPKIFQHIRI